MKHFSSILIALSFLAPCAEGSGGENAAEFLRIGVGPRAIAMGEAQTAVADDVYATYWNPAGLANLPVQEAGFMQNQYVEGISEQYAAYAFPTNRLGTFAGSVTYLHMGEFDGYDAVGQRAGSVGASDTAAAFSYARPLWRDRRAGMGLALGTTLRYLREQLDTVSASASAGDIGLLFNPGHIANDRLRGWAAGLTLRNIGSSMRFDQESFRLPQILSAGLSYNGTWKSERFVMAVDGRKPREGAGSYGAGLEIRTLTYLLARAGYSSDSDWGNGLRFGGGLVFRTLQLDYAYAGAGAFGAIHRIGVTLRIGKGQEDPLYSAERWYRKGLKEFNAHQFPEAMVSFNKALEIDPSHPNALKIMQQTNDELRTMVPD
jgi:hypothetical protein